MGIVTDINVMKTNSRTLMDYLNCSFLVVFSLARKYNRDMTFLHEVHNVIRNDKYNRLSKWDDELKEYDEDLYLKLILIGIKIHCKYDFTSDQLRENIIKDAIAMYRILIKYPPLELFSFHDNQLYPALFKKLGQRVRRYIADKKDELPDDIIEAIVTSMEVFHSCVVYFYNEVLEKKIPA